MKLLGKLAVAGVAVLALLQIVRPGIPAKPASAEVQAPPEVRTILEKDCYSCHSDLRRLAWFDEIVPAYWLVRHDILTAREHLNFSTLGSKPMPAQKAALYEAVNMIQLGVMPPAKFLALHSEAKVTPEALASLKAYLAPWSSPPNLAVTPAANAAPRPSTSLGSVQAEFNGLGFEPGFKNWKPISFTDRGDNNTFRIILGNDLAIKAAQTGNISPWPDGSQFAKIAWQQEAGADGLIHPGEFVQVEFMVKNAQIYRQSEGWNWGRWRGMDLKPYGNGADFVKECTGCHLPMRGNDYVYTLPLTSAKVDHKEIVNNQAAALPAGLPYQPLGWRAITMYVDPSTHTMATLYGNDVAGQAPYRPGAVLALVTWAQRDDPHWFGGRMPDAPQSVEFVEADSQGKVGNYRRYEGAALAEHPASIESAAQRSTFIWNLAPVVLP